MQLDPFDRLVLRLTDDEVGGRLVEYGPGHAQARLPDGKLVLIVRAGPGDVRRVRALAADIAAKVGKARLVVVGGDPELASWIATAGSPPTLLQYDGEGRLVAGRAAHAGKELRAATAAMARPLAVPDFSAVMAARVRKNRADLQQAGEFAALLRQRIPRMTWLLIGTMALVFLGQSRAVVDGVPALWVTGALRTDPEARWQVWRLLSYSWLHGSLLHIGFNGYALYLLGGSLERLVGSARFVLIYVVSVLVGAIAVLLFQGGEAVTVGASAGVWGLMTAMAVLFFRPQGIVPEALVAPMRGAFARILLINIALSLVPGISFWGHAGGGIAGAALMGSGLVAMGLPKADSGLDPNAQAGPVALAWVGGAVAAISALYAALLVMGALVFLAQG